MDAPSRHFLKLIQFDYVRLLRNITYHRYIPCMIAHKCISCNTYSQITFARTLLRLLTVSLLTWSHREGLKVIAARKNTVTSTSCRLTRGKEKIARCDSCLEWFREKIPGCVFSKSQKCACHVQNACMIWDSVQQNRACGVIILSL